MTNVSMIAAIDKNRGLGKHNKLLWHIPDDMKRFRRITTGHPVIMGRKTYDSIGKPLSNRLNIIVTRDSNFSVQGSVVVHTIEEAIALAKRSDPDEIFVIGGAQIYTLALPYADKLYLTLVDGIYDADVFFPDYSMFTKETSRQSGEFNGLTYTYVELEK